MNEMYKYLKKHSYISENKKSNSQFELSEERAECIANKYDSLLKKQQQEFIDYLEDMLNNDNDIFSVIRVKDVLNKYKEIIGGK